MKVKVKVNSVSIESESCFFSIYTFTPEPAKGFNLIKNVLKIELLNFAAEKSGKEIAEKRYEKDY